MLCVFVLLIFDSWCFSGDLFVFRSDRNLFRLYRDMFFFEFCWGGSCGCEWVVVLFFVFKFDLVEFEFVINDGWFFDLFLVVLYEVDDIFDNFFFSGELFLFKMFKNLWRLYIEFFLCWVLVEFVVFFIGKGRNILLVFKFRFWLFLFVIWMLM